MFPCQAQKPNPTANTPKELIGSSTIFADYLRGNLHRPVKLAELANVACFSEFHFHEGKSKSKS
jgi:hypothetical protein